MLWRALKTVLEAIGSDGHEGTYSGPQRMPKSGTLEPIALYNPHSLAPRCVREYDLVIKRSIGIFTGKGLAGAVEFYRSLQSDAHRKLLLADYHRLLSDMHDRGIPGLAPRRLDFHALPVDARPYLLAPYIGSLVGQTYPMLCWEQSSPAAGALTYIFTGGPADTEFWTESLPKISSWLGGTWTISASTANTLTLTRRTPLPETIVFNRTMLKRGGLFVGIDTTTHRPAYIPLSDMTSGTFVTGAAGMGKTVALHVILRSIFANLRQFTAVYLVDGKDGVAFSRYSGLHPKIHVLWEDAHVYDLAAKLVVTMQERNTRQRAQGIDNATGDYIALVIDEMATFAAKPSSDSKNPVNKAHAAFIDNLARLAMRGRSTGLRLIISAQSPVAEQVPVPVRANCQTTIAFRVPIDAHATALFGQLEGLPGDPRKLPRGHAVIAHGLQSTYQAVQFPVAPLINPRRRQ